MCANERLLLRSFYDVISKKSNQKNGEELTALAVDDMAHNTATKTLRDFLLSTARAIVQFSSGALNLIFVVCAALRLNIKQTTGNYEVF